MTKSGKSPLPTEIKSVLDKNKIRSRRKAASKRFQKMYVQQRQENSQKKVMPAQSDSRVLMTSIRVRQKARRKSWTPFMNTFYTSCPLLFTRKKWTSSAQTF